MFDGVNDHHLTPCNCDAAGVRLVCSSYIYVIDCNVEQREFLASGSLLRVFQVPREYLFPRYILLPPSGGIKSARFNRQLTSVARFSIAVEIG